MSTRIALAQVFLLDGDRSGNFRRIENAMIEAKAAGADIICFPEMAILGWVNPDAHERAHPIPGADSDRLGALAKQYGLFVAIGLGEKDGEHLYDAAILLDDTGKILLKHRKNNILSELMTPAYTPGQGVQVVSTKFGKIGLMICADTFLDKLTAEMAGLQPDLLLVPYGWAEHEDQWPQHGKQLEEVVINTAKHIKTTVVGTDLVGEISKGPWAGYVYGGQSLAVDASGNILAKLADRDREVKIIEVILR
ncbi:MAG: carbon-nitrogen hydrolase family protein [Saprospiraceae bacterium]|nr:carbon-nitrogen hydrolase family protein [Lewinella sp.]